MLQATTMKQLQQSNGPIQFVCGAPLCETSNAAHCQQDVAHESKYSLMFLVWFSPPSTTCLTAYGTSTSMRVRVCASHSQCAVYVTVYVYVCVRMCAHVCDCVTV
jgi:hypothetical protein